MTKLLSANLLRLRKSHLFWGTLALSFGFGVWVAVSQVLEQMKYGGFEDSPAFSRYTSVVGMVIAVFVSLFFGTEYSDGTIRNKLITGQSRISIYLADLITASVCSMLFSIAYLIACFAVGAPFMSSGLLRHLETQPTVFALTIVGSLVLTLAYSALFLLITLNCARKTTSAVVCILGAFILLMVGIYLNGRLEAPEYITGYELSVDGQVVPAEPELNPDYLQGTKREVYQFLYDFTPGGQTVQYSMVAAGNLHLMPLYSLIILIVSTGAGAALFRRKDLK